METYKMPEYHIKEIEISDSAAKFALFKHPFTGLEIKIPLHKYVGDKQTERATTKKEHYYIYRLFGHNKIGVLSSPIPMEFDRFI